MMAIKYKLQCPDCGQYWSVVLKQGEELPNYCAHCGAYVGGDPEFVPSKVTISTALGKSADVTYRAMEQASEARAEMAGDPSLKITNIRDNLREGDVAAMPVNNAVTKYADEAHNAFGFNMWQGSPQADLARANSGPGRQHNGSKVLSAIQSGKGTPVIPAASKLIKGNWGGASA